MNLKFGCLNHIPDSPEALRAIEIVKSSGRVVCYPGQYADDPKVNQQIACQIERLWEKGYTATLEGRLKPPS